MMMQRGSAKTQLLMERKEITNVEARTGQQVWAEEQLTTIHGLTAAWRIAGRVLKVRMRSYK